MLLSLVSAIALLASLGCRSEPEGLGVMVASSLSPALPALEEAWLAQPDAEPLRFEVGPTSRLVRQLEAGAGAEVLLSASERWSRRAHDHASMSEGRVFARNRLVVAVPASRTAPPPRTLGELADLRRVAVAVAPVPLGSYSESALRSAGVFETLRPKLVGASSARTALGWVAGGAVDAGLLYASDARDPNVRVAFEVEGPTPRYSVSHRSERGAAFARFLEGDAAQAILSEFGFERAHPNAGEAAR